MKAKVSVTLDDALVAFVDSQPGSTRSEKVETALRRYRDAWRDMKLREELAVDGEGADDDQTAWQQIMQEEMWKESGVATPGRSPSRRSRNRTRVRSTSRI